MPRTSAADRRDREETAGSHYFAQLAPGKYFLVTTPRPKGAPVSARVQGAIDGDRAYFRVWSRSGMIRRLRQADRVQVTACTSLGLVSYGEPMYAAVRRLTGEEADRAARQLARKYPAGRLSWHRIQVHYELVAP